MSKLVTFTRRAFLFGTVAISGGVLFGFYKYKQDYPNPLDTPEHAGSALTPYVKIDQSGITLIAPRAEMGQGVRTTLAALVAEELEVDIETVNIEHGPASYAYYNQVVLEEGLPFPATDNGFVARTAREFVKVPAKFIAMQITGGSTSTPDGFEKMRMAGAVARQMLLEAASQTLNLPLEQLKAQAGKVVSLSGQHITYEELAPLAAKLTPPEQVQLKPQNQWQQLGRSLPRDDMIPKCTGTAQFGIDTQLPNMLFATIKTNPHLGAKWVQFNAEHALTMRGVKQVVPIEEIGFAVLATNTWYAFKAADAVDVTWRNASYPIDSESFFELVEASFNDQFKDSQFKHEGDIETQLTSNNDWIDLEYRAPFLAHATMEPMNATVLYDNGRLDIWAGNQNPTQARKEGMQLTDLDETQVFVHTPYLGGGFGRRAEMDFVKYAVIVAKQVPGTPVKVTWTREEDMTHDAYRPLAMARAKGRVQNGQIQAIDLKLAAPSVLASQMGRMGMPVPGPDVTIVQAAWDQPYAIEHYRVTGYKVETDFPVSSWRSVGASQNGFFHESVIDELAYHGKVDPLAMRLQLINHEPSKKVLEAVAELSQWKKPRAKNIGLGVAFVMSFGVPCAQVIEVENTEQGIKILNAYAVVDVGIALDPTNIEAQVISGLNFGLAAAIMGNITLEKGQVQQTNFHQFDSLRMRQAPNIKVKILENGEKLRGIGEPAVPPAAPALANAIFAVTGHRIRELPLNQSIKFA